jgi:hypothetical protein
MNISEWLNSQMQSNSSIRQLYKEQIDKTNPRRELTSEENKPLRRLLVIANKFKS